MVRRIIQKVLGKEINGLHEAAYLLAIFSIFSQILALVRDRLLTYFFGASSNLDVYYAAFKIPDIIYVLVASTVSVSVLVPFLSEKIYGDKEKAKKYINSLFSFFLISIIIVSAISFILMPFLVNFLFAGIPNDKIDSLIWLSRLLLIQPILLGVSNFLGSIAQVFKQFALFSSGPVLYNIGIILGIIFLYPIFGIYGLGLGVIIGVIFHMIIQIPIVATRGFLPKLYDSIDFSLIKETVSLALPRTFTLGVSSLAILLITALASRISEGSISIFTLSSNLQGVPLTIIGMSYSLAAFPVLSEYFIKKKIDFFIQEISTALRHIIFWSLPIIAIFVVIRAQIVRVILGASPKFSWDDTRLTAAVLAVLSLAVLSQGINLLLTRAFYASKETKKPLIINSIGAILMFALSFIFLKIFYIFPNVKMFFAQIFRVENVIGNEILALGIGVLLASSLSAFFLWVYFEKKFRGTTQLVLSTLWQSLLTAFIIGFISYISLNLFNDVFSLTTVLGVFLQGFLSGIIGIIFGIFILKILGNKEIIDVWNVLHKKIWKAKVVLAENERVL